AISLCGTGLSANQSGLYGALSNFVFSLGLTDGRLRWQRSGAFDQGAPALTTDTLCILGQLLGDDQTLYLFKLNLAHGSERGRLTLEHTETTQVDGSTMSIVSSGGELIMQYDNILAALNVSSGRLLWTPKRVNGCGFPAIPNVAVVTAPAVANGVIYAG